MYASYRREDKSNSKKAGAKQAGGLKIRQNLNPATQSNTA